MTGGSSTLILALPGTGKTSLLAAIMKDRYFKYGKRLLKNCIKMLQSFNQDRTDKFEMPTQPPFYADVNSFKVKFKVGYDKWFEPYIINPKFMGINDEKRQPQFVLPYSQIFIPEIASYADSRKSSCFPESLAQLFAKRRHFYLDIFMDGHYGNFIDQKVRNMCDKVIDLQRQEHEYDELGRIVRTKWYCREFDSMDEYDAYLTNPGNNFKETIYTNEGNIFSIFDSRGCLKEFIPPEGVQFSTLKPLTLDKIAKLPAEIARFYNYSKPKE